MGYNEEFYICFGIYFSSFVDDWKNIAKIIAMQLFDACGLNPTNYNLTTLVDKKTSVKPYKYTDKKFQSALLQENVEGFALVFGEGDIKYRWNAPLCIQFVNKCANHSNHGQVYLHLRPEYLNLIGGMDQKESCKKVVNLLLQIGSAKYGIVHPIEISKNPQLFIAGFPNETLSEDERQSCMLWQVKKSEYDQKIRNVYFGNLISSKHINSIGTKIRNISAEVGESNIIKIEDDLLLIFMPENLESIAEKEHDAVEAIKKVSMILNSIGILLK